MQVATYLNMFGYMSLPDSTPQLHTASIQGIKLSHLVYSPEAVREADLEVML
jgi:hypothetical protein